MRNLFRSKKRKNEQKAEVFDNYFLLVNINYFRNLALPRRRNFYQNSDTRRNQRRFIRLDGEQMGRQIRVGAGLKSCTERNYNCIDCVSLLFFQEEKQPERIVESFRVEYFYRFDNFVEFGVILKFYQRHLRYFASFSNQYFIVGIADIVRQDHPDFDFV